MKSFQFALILVFSVVAVPGCMIVDEVQEITRQSLKTLKPRASGYRNWNEEEGDGWEFVGKEGRGHQAMQQENDALIKKMQSAKARSIERNLGIE
jgi:hypothetical protein